jgi:hypothetical protein
LAAYRAYGEQHCYRSNFEKEEQAMAVTDNMVERLAVLDMSIQAMERRIAAVSPGRQPPVWHQTLERLIDARRIYSARMTQLDSLR